MTLLPRKWSTERKEVLATCILCFVAGIFVLVAIGLQRLLLCSEFYELFGTWMIVYRIHSLFFDISVTFISTGIYKLTFRYVQSSVGTSDLTQGYQLLKNKVRQIDNNVAV